MRKLLALTVGVLLLLTLTVGLCFAQGGTQKTEKITGLNSYVYYPVGYETAGAKFATIIFFPGVGQAGTDGTQLLVYGPSKYAPTLKPNALVISVQPTYGWIQQAQIESIVSTIISTYKVDTNKIVLTGLSAGATGIEQYALTPAYSYRLAGIVVMSAPEVQAFYPNIPAVAPLPWKALGFSGTQDSHTEKMQELFTKLGQASPGKTLFITGNYAHCCWNQYYDPAYKIPGTTLSIYDWAMSQSKAIPVVTPPVDTTTPPPTVLPADSVILRLPGKIEVEFRKDGAAIWKIIP